MCGVILIKRFDGKDARRIALKRYKAQELRGQRGFGFVALKQGTTIAYERSETDKGIKDKLEKVPCDELLFHHRTPTSTPNFEETAHPIFVSNEKLKHDYYVIHNGIIEDDGDWKAVHNKEGFNYTTEITGGYLMKNGSIKGEHLEWNDSETLAIELAQDFEANGGGVQVTGSIAFIALEVNKKTKKAVRLLWGRNESSPLKMYLLPKVFLSLCSEGVGDIVKENTLYSYSYKTGDITERPYQVGLKKVYTYTGYDKEFGFKSTKTTSYLPEVPDDYLVQLENREELKDDIKLYKDQGFDTTELEAELAMIEYKIGDMEKLFDDYEYRLT